MVHVHLSILFDLIIICVLWEEFFTVVVKSMKHISVLLPCISMALIVIFMIGLLSKRNLNCSDRKFVRAPRVLLLFRIFITSIGSFAILIAFLKSQSSVVSILTRLRAGWSEVRILGEETDSSLHENVKIALGHAQLPNQ